MFDGWKDGPGRETRNVTGGITIIYSGIGERADTVIKRIISLQQRKWVVVTSDRAIVSFAWRVTCVPIDSEDFSRAVAKALREIDKKGEPDDYYAEEEEEGYQIMKKGNPRKRSKKQKEIQRVLEKL